MLLLHVSVECWVAKIRFVAVLALEVTAVDVILGSALRELFVDATSALIFRLLSFTGAHTLGGASTRFGWSVRYDLLVLLEGRLSAIEIGTPYGLLGHVFLEVSWVYTSSVYVLAHWELIGVGR